MIIDNPEQFKAWLTAVLEPLCDADPAALAKYVYALVKKDKTLDELRGGMVEQLDVFLQHETKSFVELLFKTLETQKYELPLPKIDSTIGGTTPPCINTQSNLPVIKTENIDIQIPTVPLITSPTLQQQTVMPLQINGSSIMPLSSATTTTTTTQVLPTTTPITTSPTIPIMIKRENRKSESEKDDKDKRPRSRGRIRSKTRSRSRSWERDRRRSRSRDHIRRDRERDRSRPWRNKSPPSSVRRHDRRRSRSRSLSPLRTRNTRDIIDNRDHRSRFRNRSPSPLRSSSRSIERKKLDKLETQQLQQQQQHSPGGTIIQDSNHGDIDMRSSSSSQPVRSVVIAPPFKNNQQTTNDNFKQQKCRCRDFDEKGYCMRGDLCPYDHGTDPVVLEDVALSRVLTFGPHGGPTPTTQPIVANVVNDTQQPGHNGNSQPPHLPLSTLPPPHLRNQHHANMGTFAEYNPDAPSMEPRGLPWPRHPGQAPGIYGRGQRELISVPVIPHPNQTDINHHQQHQHQQHPQQQQQQQQQQQINPLKRKQAFDFNRLGPKQRAVHNSLNCSLELKKVPRTLNNITQLNNHFSKFGKIVNIQVNFCGDPEAALVTFQLPAEAKAAYRSTEAVLNNRFIKVFWHNNTANNNNNNSNSNTITNVVSGISVGAIENVPPGSCRPSVKERLGAAVTTIKSENNEYVPTRRSTDEQVQTQQQQQATQNIVQSAQKLTTTVATPTTTTTTTPALTTTGPTREDKVLAIKKTQEILAAKETIKKKQEESRKEAIKLTADLRKRKGELLEKNLNEIRVLIEKAEKNPEQKDTIMTTIKILQQSIDELRKDLSTNNGQQVSTTTTSSSSSSSSTTTTSTLTTTTTTTPSVQTNNTNSVSSSNNNSNSFINNSNIKTQIKTREQTQKEILDAELDLMTAQQEGQDAGELQKRLNELKLQAAVLGISTGTAVARNVKTARIIRGGHTLTYRGGRGGIGRGSYAHVSVDHRPTSLLISGYESDDKTEVLAHFQQFGEIVNQIVDDATPSIVINYKSRKEAEVALIKGRTFQDRLLSVTWVSSHHLHRGGSGGVAVGGTGSSVSGGGGAGAGSTGGVSVGNNNNNNNTNSALSVRTEQTQINDEDIDLESAAEALLLEENEEEEDEDGESRSWRR